MSKSTLKTTLLTWHRRSGLIIAPIIVMLVITGIAINHSDELGWAHKPVHSPIIAALYGIDNPKISQGFALNSDWLTQVEDELYLNQQSVITCAGKLKGAVMRVNDMALLCGDALILLTHHGELIEKLTNLPISYPNAELQLGLHTGDTTIVLQAGEQVWVLDESLGDWRAEASSNNSKSIVWSQLSPLPKNVAQTLNRQRPIPGITQERFLLDLHSGRLFGKLGVLIVDIAALFLLALAASGAYSVWLRQHSKKRKVRKS